MECSKYYMINSRRKKGGGAEKEKGAKEKAKILGPSNTYWFSTSSIAKSSCSLFNTEILPRYPYKLGTMYGQLNTTVLSREYGNDVPSMDHRIQPAQVEHAV